MQRRTIRLKDGRDSRPPTSLPRLFQTAPPLDRPRFVRVEPERRRERLVRPPHVAVGGERSAERDERPRPRRIELRQQTRDLERRLPLGKLQRSERELIGLPP